MKGGKRLEIEWNSLLARYLPILLFSVSLFSLLWNAGGDPAILRTYGDYSDEGYWLQNPVNKILHGVFLTDDQSQSFFGAPLFNQLVTLQFRLFGISFFSARLVSIFFLLLTTVVLYFILKPRVSGKGHILLYLSSFLLLFDNKLYYQWATPIPVEIFFQSLLLLFLCNNSFEKYRTILVTALLVYLSIISKTTSVWLLCFVCLLFVFDSVSFSPFAIRKRGVTGGIVLLVLCVVPFLATNSFFAKIEPGKFATFNQLLKRNVSFFELSQIKDVVNPLYYLKNLIAIFKFPNSTFIIVVLFAPLLLVKSVKTQLKRLLSPANRAVLVLVLYSIVFVVFLISIGAFGYDRRQVNLIFPLFALVILLYEKCKSKEIVLWQNLVIIGLFLFVSWVQVNLLYKFLYHPYNAAGQRSVITGIDSQSKMIFAGIFMLYAVVSSFLLFRYKLKYLFVSFITINVLFHVCFLNSDTTLLQANQKVGEIAKTYQCKYISGMYAHHLAVESDILPIFWIDTSYNYPDWNINFPLFSKTNPTLITTDTRQNRNSGYFRLQDIPAGFNVERCDTLLFYRNRFINGFNDTVLLYIVGSTHR